MAISYLQDRDRDLFWSIYRLGPLTTSDVGKAFFRGNRHNASRKLKALRDAGYLVSKGSHLPPKDGSWHPAGRAEFRHEVTLKALREVCPAHNEPVPTRWEPRW